MAKPVSSAARFARGTTVFNCACCTRSTRITHQPDASILCFECYELAGQENDVFDGCADVRTVESRDRLLAKIVSLGGNADFVRADFRELFAFLV